MLDRLIRPNNLSQKMIRVIFSIYLGVACLVTGLQFLSEYLKTKNSILNELKQLEQTVKTPISTSLWQYNQNQLDALITGLINMPIIEGVEVFDQHAQAMISERSYDSASAPLSLFEIKTDLNWSLNNKPVFLGTLVLYSSSEVVLNRVWFGFFLIAITAIIKLSILFALFIWAFDRYLASPLKELMVQVNEIQLSHDVKKRIDLSSTQDNELGQLQEHMNRMLSSIEADRQQLLENEQARREWLEEAVAKRTADLQLLNEKLKQLAARDSLTGVLNRGSFFEAAQHLLTLAQRQKSPASFILMDLDYFKNINDTYGHFIGDQVLMHFTQTLQNLFRTSDLIGRVGGEEFAVFLSETSIEDAFRLADKIRKIVGDSVLEFDGQSVSYTVSMGIESYTNNNDSIGDLFKRADLKLYGAKDKGRDCIEK